MRICKYCKKPILDNNVWNPDSEGNGYHHACLCLMEFASRDRQIYNKGRADALKQIEPLTDIEQRIFLAAMNREEKVCKEVDADDSDDGVGVNLVAVCHSIERKVKRALWE